MEYVTSKQQCEDSIIKNHVCERCGRQLVALETVDNSNNPTFWSGCMHKDNPIEADWGHFTKGVPIEIFNLAEKIVCQEGSYYDSLEKRDYNKTKEDKEYWFQEQQSGWAKLLLTIEYLKSNEPYQNKQQMLDNFN